MKVKDLLKKWIPVICLVPLIAGAIGYYFSGDGITDALYASFALYFTNPISDAYNGFVEFARWTAPLVTAAGILCALKSVWNAIKWRVMAFSKDSVAVYTDDDIEIKFNKKTKAIYPGERFQSYYKSHIILFSSDQQSFQFFEEHKAQLKGKAVYIGLRELEMGLVKELDGVILFDVNNSISRNFWKDISLWNQKQKEVSVVIYGENILAQSILSTGLQLNLFSKEQSITYHIVSDNQHFRIKHFYLPLQNHDRIVYHRSSEDDLWETIEKADLVIVADLVSAEMLQTFSARVKNGRLYYYSPYSGDAGDYIEFGRPVAFGRNEDIFTDENIRLQKLVQTAIALNEQYAKVYKTEEDWNRLSGFLKSSNISSADFQETLSGLPVTMSEEELAELEHIRWCRFYYLNYWKPGDTENGAGKDNNKRIHKDLKGYDELDEDEKDKDRTVVKMARENNFLLRDKNK